jgi:hypothetical protein
MSEEKVIHNYPSNISNIGYASFLEIKRWSYDRAKATVMRDFNDAAGSIQDTNIMQQSSVFGKGVLEKIKGISSGKSLVDEYERGIRQSAQATINMGGGKNIFGLNKPMKAFKGPLLDPEEAYGKVTPDELLGGLDGSQDMSHLDPTIAETSAEHKKAYEAHIKRKEDFAASQKGLTATSTNLALPNEFQYEYGANWNNEFKLGTLALLAENFTAGATVAGMGAAMGLTQFLATAAAKGNVSQSAAAEAKATAGGVNRMVDPFNVGTQVNPRNLVGLAGLAPNENAMQFFKKMDFRNFDMTFQFAARSSGEAQQIESIIQWFKVAMHPGHIEGSGNAILLQFPDVFQLIPKFVNVDPETRETKISRHPMLPKTKLCALTNLRVNTTPMNQLTTTFDGSFPLITLNCRFTELTALTKGDFGQLINMQDQRRGHKLHGDPSGTYRGDMADSQYYSY